MTVLLLLLLSLLYRYAKLGDKGSELPRMPTGVVWETGSVVETIWSIRANHGGGWQYRLCPANATLTEECFQQNPIPFAGDSSLELADGSRLPLKSTFVSDGTLPLGSTWQMNPLPNTRQWFPDRLGYQFPPPCNETAPPEPLGHGICSGEWMTNITFYDQLLIPEHLEPGEYVLGFRHDCESSAQVWQSCADITLAAPKQ